MNDITTIERPWMAGACYECVFRLPVNMCKAHLCGGMYVYCPTIQICTKFRRSYQVVGLCDVKIEEVQ